MKFINYNLRKIFVILTGIILLSFLNSCGIWDPADARKVSPNADERVKKILRKARVLHWVEQWEEVKLIISSLVLTLCGEPH